MDDLPKPPQSPKGPVTMKDVAARAGVTKVVVSHVLHQKASTIRVSEATAERVRHAAKDLGYRVNVLARNFRNRQTMQIGVLHGMGFPRPRFDAGSRYFAALMDGIVDGAFRHGYSVTLCPTLLGATPGDALSDGRFDGFIWYSTLPSEENHRMLESCSVPLVLLHARKEEYGNRFSTVICDNDGGIRLALDHLVELGHRRIGMLLDAPAIAAEVAMRRDAFLTHAQGLGLDVSENDVVNVAGNESGVAIYLDAPQRHTAILTQSDALAATVLNAAPGYDVDIPGGLSVVGFDSTSYCDELRPRLTSVHQPLAAMGEQAVELLVQAMGSEPPPPTEVVLPCRLDVRESTARV